MHPRLILLAITVASLTSPAAGAAQEPASESALFEVGAQDARSVMNTLRAILATRQVEVSDGALLVTGSPRHLEDVGDVVALLEVEPGSPSVETLLLDSGETAVSRILLRSTDPRQVMNRLRSEIRVRGVATLRDPPLVLIRDSPEKVEAAIDLVAALEDEADPP